MARFVRRELPLRAEVMNAVDEMMLEPPGKIWRGAPRDVTWDPVHTRVFGKTGHVSADGRAFVFVSMVFGHAPLDFEAVTRAMAGLREARLVEPR